MKQILPILVLLVFAAVACDKEPEMVDLTVNFEHLVDNNPVQFNQLVYENTAGNPYQVEEIKYFVSRLSFVNDEGETFSIVSPTEFYVDTEYPNTLQHQVKLPEGTYTSMNFVFGLDEELNKSNRFVNPPESNFSWPDIIGGGYHYMQINGKFENAAGELCAMNFHTGIGQLYGEDFEISTIYEFVQNYFAVSVPCNFEVDDDQENHISLQMEIQRWFDTPNVYDHNVFGSGIMQNQEAQTLIKANGHNVFSVSNN